MRHASEMPPFRSDGPHDSQRCDTYECQQRRIGTADQAGRRERKDTEDDATDRRQRVTWGWHVARLQPLEGPRCSQAHKHRGVYCAGMVISGSLSLVPVSASVKKNITAVSARFVLRSLSSIQNQ